MVKFITYLYLFSMLSLVSLCSKEPDEELTPEIEFDNTVISDGSAIFPSEGGKISINFTTNVDWTAQSSATWMSVNPSSGKLGPCAVTIKADANTTTESRSAMLTISAQGKSAAVKVVQDGRVKADLSLSLSTAEIGSAGGSKSVGVTSNQNWTVSSDQNWCTVSPERGSGNGAFDIMISENENTSDRSATVTVKAGSENNAVTKSVSVFQSTKSGTVPTVSTSTVSSITSTSALAGGNVTSDGGFTVTERGVCWSTSQNPDIKLSTKTADGSGAGTFISNITGLSPSTTYYVRAYATNSEGTAYGSQITFTTKSISGDNEDVDTDDNHKW